MPWRRDRLPTPVFWPGEFHGLFSHGVEKSRTQLSDFRFHLFCQLDKEYTCNGWLYVLTALSHTMPRYLTKYYFWVCVFPGELSICVGDLGKQTVFSNVGVPHPILWGPEWNRKEKEREMENFLPLSLSWVGTWVSRSWTGTYTIDHPVLRLSDLKINHPFS